ncbi:unnamed protein product [Cylindrotheca closterium]|uniref:Kinesin light chain n=1 Tax=Cylindrotheca closterium TaxID=2856 RepID=A0AAD2CML5_9STRA|nr:unnamed protein product [Cylindrotheca closterium]
MLWNYFKVLSRFLVKSQSWWELTLIWPTCYETITIVSEPWNFTRGRWKSQKRALEIAKNQYGEEHQHVATILQNMGRISSREGAYDAAIQLYQKSLEISKRTLGEDHLSAAEIYQSLGLIFQQQGDLDGAYSLYEKARHMYQAGLGAWHTLVADSYDMQAGVRWQECRFSDSRSLHDRARKIRSALQGRNSRSALRDGKSNFKFPSSSGVMVTNDLGFGISKNNVDEDHPYYAYGLDCVARSLMNSENPEEALLPIEKLIEVIKKTFGDQHVLLANVYQNMATVLRRLGMLDEAMESYEMFRCIVEQAREREIAVDRCSEWARAYEDIASLLLQRERTSRVADAFGALLAALKMRKRVALESNHEMLYIISTFESISKLLSENNKAMMIETMYENEPLARTRNRVVADGLELYQGMIRRSLCRDSCPAKMLLDAIAKVSEANENDDDQNSIHSKVCNLQNLLTERNYKELHSTVVELLDDLRKGH